MSEHLNTDILGALLVAVLMGGIVFFNLVVMPYLLAGGRQGARRTVLRQIFPWYYLFVILLSGSAIYVVRTEDSAVMIALTGVALSAVFARVYLLPRMRHLRRQLDVSFAAPGRLLFMQRLALAVNFGQLASVSIVMMNMLYVPNHQQALPAVVAQNSVQAISSAQLTAQTILRSQLRALKRNDHPKPDAGIGHAFSLAHPDNQTQAGPLQRFTRILKGEHYRALIDHREAVIQPLHKGPNMEVFRVIVMPDSGAVVEFIWHLERAYTDELNGDWRTTIVSPARFSNRLI